MSAKSSNFLNNMPVKKTFRAFAWTSACKTRQIWKFTNIICQIWVTAEVGITQFCDTLTFGHLAREKRRREMFSNYRRGKSRILTDWIQSQSKT